MKEYSSEIIRLGAELKAIREKNNLTVDTVSNQLKIQAAYINAIEQGKIDLLPSGFYRKSFIKEYCGLFGAEQLFKIYEDALAGFEASELVERTAAEQMKHNENVPGSALVNDREYRLFNAKPLLVTAAIMLLLGTGAIFMFRTDISSKATGKSVMQLAGGTEVIVKEKEAKDKKLEQLAEEEARKLAEERAKTEEEQFAVEVRADTVSESGEDKDSPADAQAEPQLAKNELYISAPEQDITISVSQNKIPVYEGKVQKGKAMRIKVEGEFPMRVRYENPNKTEVIFGGAEFKPLHPSNQGRSRYYWSDGKVTFTVNKNVQ